MAEPVKGERTVEEIAAALMADPCAHQGAGYSGTWKQHECRMCISVALRAERDRGDRLAERVTVAECRSDYLEDQLADEKARVENLEKALREIADADPDAPEVESWKWLARKFMESARSALAAPTGEGAKP